LTSFYGKTGFSGGEEILNCGRASSAGGKVIGPTQSMYHCSRIRKSLFMV